jgi:hypothetical protein
MKGYEYHITISNMISDSDMWKCVMDHDVIRLWWACNIGVRARCVSEHLALCGSIGYSLRLAILVHAPTRESGAATSRHDMSKPESMYNHVTTNNHPQLI